MAVLEPTVIPGLDRALLELLLIFGAIGSAIFILTISSIVGIVRAVQRRLRGSRSRAAVTLALTTFMITTIWLLYWAGNNILHNSHPFDGLLIINLLLCILPFAWLISAIRANRFAGKKRREQAT